MTWRNTFRPMLVPVGVPLAALVVGSVLALSLLPEHYKWTACVGVVALVGLVLTLIKNAAEARKTAQPITATALMLTAEREFVPGVEAFNSDTATVLIKAVTLVVKTGDEEQREELVEEEKAKKLEHELYDTSYPEGVSRYELGSKKAVRFHLNRHSERKWDELLKPAPETFWIEIECFGGARLWVTGAEIQAAIRNRFPNMVAALE